MTVQETWFGGEDNVLLGIWNLPDGEVARGAVVLCPPLGKETVHAYRLMALAAQQLCADGVAVLRFDYPGCGDSTGDELAPDAVDRWVQAIHTAVEHARCAGAREVALLGLRAGALLATAAAGSCGPLTALALWDPVTRGRTYLREQSVLYRLKVDVASLGGTAVAPDSDSDVAALVGAELHPDAAAALRSLSLADCPGANLTAPIVVAARTERWSEEVLAGFAERTGASRQVLSGHEQVFDVATFEVRLPGASTAALTAWLAQRFGARAEPLRVPLRRTAVLGGSAGQAAVRERLARLGPDGLFGILTQPLSTPDHEPGDGRVVVALPSSTEYRVGTGRIWVQLARRLAANGVCCLRFDRRGTGDSSVVHADERTPAYSAAAHQDLDAVLAALGRPPELVTLVGHCSGAWLAGEAASEGAAASVVLLGAIRFLVGRQVQDWTPVDDPENVAVTTRLGRAKTVMKPFVPDPVWRWMGRRGLAHVPEVVLRRLRDAGARVTLVMAPADHRAFVANRGVRALARLHSSGWPVVVHVGDAGDHSLVHRGLRRFAIDRAVQAVLAEHGVGAAPVASARTQ